MQTYQGVVLTFPSCHSSHRHLQAVPAAAPRKYWRHSCRRALRHPPWFSMIPAKLQELFCSQVLALGLHHVLGTGTRKELLKDLITDMHFSYMSQLCARVPRKVLTTTGSMCCPEGRLLSSPVVEKTKENAGKPGKATQKNAPGLSQEESANSCL